MSGKDEWIPTSVGLPTNDTVVLTKIADKDGERNFQKLRRRNNLWFLPDGSMYVYYTPTHWKP